MKALKSLAFTSLLAISLGLTGCTVNLIKGTVEETKNPTTKIVKEQDSVVGFVINQDGRLVMLGQRYVYVFDDNDKTDRLKKLLSTPQFLKLKYHWEITNGGAFDEKARHKISYSRNNAFNFSAFFWYQYSTAEELAIFQKVGFAQSDSMENANQEHFTIIPDFQGKVYQHNNSTKALLKTAKPLSKPYQFGIDRETTDRAKILGGALLFPLVLPFAVVGDILILPISLPITLNGGDIDWH